MAHNPPLILIADDQKPTVLMLERIFVQEGYQVACVYNGAEAFNSAQNIIPDLILLDVNMPLMNGFDVLKKLRETRITQNIPTILITAMGDLTDVVQGLNLGADDYIRKPFHPQELLARAQSKIRAHQLETALQERTRETEILLRVSDELNRHLQLDELIYFILYAILDLIPSQQVVLCFLEDKHVSDLRSVSQTESTPDQSISQYFINDVVYSEDDFVQWDNDITLLPPYPCGIAIRLMFQDTPRFVLMAVGNKTYDDRHQRLFAGLAHQASLALQNAELYQIKASYAEELEIKVAERTAELESTQQMLVRSEKLASIGRLAAAIAHEINNPLLPIKLDLEGIIEDIRNSTSVSEGDIEHILENVQRIENTVENLLGFTGNKQVDSARFALVDLNHIISGIIKLNRKLLQQEQITVEENLSAIPNIYGNRYQLEYVFMNLTLNAKDAMPKGGKLTYKTYASDQSVIVTVSDTGIGISPDIIDNIFEPFTSTKEDGNGLGLYISYDIVVKHDATIHVDTKVGTGTTFVIEFKLDN